MKGKKEIRVMQNPELRIKEQEDGSKMLVGYSALFNKWSQDLGGFVERISPGSFQNALINSDVRNLFNHDPNYVTGRTKAGTLRLKEDDKGLYKEVDLPDTQFARDLATLIERGDITGQSFGFVVKRDTWEENKETKAVTRTIEEFDRIMDVSDVVFPAYPDTNVALRSMEEWRKDAEADPMVAEDITKEADPKVVESYKVSLLKRQLELKLKQED